MAKHALVRLSDERIVTIKDTIEFPSNVECEWRDVPDSATLNDTFKDGVLIPYSAPPAPELTALERIHILETEITKPRFISDLMSDPTTVYSPHSGQTVGDRHVELRSLINSERSNL